MAATSCSKWLDITPENMIIEDNLYKTGTGFQNSLNGIYGDLSKENLYGREMTYGFVDVLSQNYVLSSNAGIRPSYSYYNDVMTFKFKDKAEVKNAINGMWSSSYSVIANCNILLKRVETADPILFENGELERNLIKGEALGLRAMLHFDVLRLFGAAPIKGDSKQYTPYVTVSPYYGGQAPETVESIMKKVERDMLEARDLILQYDTSTVKSRDNLSYTSRFQRSQTATDPTFMLFRGYRINAVAINGLLARLYNYWGKHEEAKRYAEETINFVSNVSRKTKALRYTPSGLATDRKFIQDQIFAVADAFLQQNYLNYTLTASNNHLLLNKKMVLFEGSPTSHSADVRFLYLVDKNNKNGYAPLKNVRKDGSEAIISVTEDMIPMLKLSEMDFIMAEYYASVGDYANAELHINNVRKGRKNIGMSLGVKDMKTFKENLFIEVRKELFQEGQIFFYYKKYDELLTAKMSTDDFILPTPDSENIN